LALRRGGCKQTGNEERGTRHVESAVKAVFGCNSAVAPNKGLSRGAGKVLKFR
jgi:hypothetical protein